MKLLASVILIFSFLQFLVALTNRIFSQRLVQSSNTENQLISVLIPVRNEQDNIGNLLNDLLKQDYGNIEILIFNDQSTDQTGNIVKFMADNDNRIRLYNSSKLPEGWLGKNYACYSLSKKANGDILLFIDADVRLKCNIIGNSVNYLLKEKLSLLSIFPVQIMKSKAEWLTVPLMNFILLSLLPLFLVQKSRHSSLAAANGQFMLFSKKEYDLLQPHEKMKSNRVEDIEIARYYKLNNQRIACLANEDMVSCRMYKTFYEAVNGFSKNISHFFGNSLTITVTFWLITTLGWIIIFITFSWPVIILYFFMVVSARILISVVSHQNIIMNIKYLIPQQLVMGMIIYKAFQNRRKKQFVWKDRNI